MNPEPLTESLQETLSLFDESGEPRTTNEVSGSLDIGRRSTYDRLEKLVERELLETKKVGANARVWWRPPTSGDGVGTPAESSSVGDMFQRFIENVPGIAFRSLRDGGWPMLYVSDGCADLTGYDRETVESGKVSWGEGVIHPQDRNRVQTEVDEQLRDGTQFAVQYRIRTAEDEIRWVSEHGCLVSGVDGVDEAIEGVIIDITAQKAAEGDLADRSEQLQSLVEATEEYAIFMLDPDGHVQTWNPGAERIKGYEADEIIGKSFTTFYTDEDRAAGVPERNLATAEADGVVEDEGWRIRADGTHFWANVTITAIRDDDGELDGFAKVTRDMTDRRERERQLKRERDLNERIFETAPVRLAIFSSDGSIERINAQAKRQHGLDGTDVDDISHADLDLFGLDGEPLSGSDYPVNKVLETGKPLSDQMLRHTGPDGKRRWSSVTASPLLDDDGTIERVVVVANDVTELKRNERKIQRQRDALENELFDVFERVDDAFFALDEEWCFTHVNEQAANLIEVDPSRAVGESIWDLFPATVDSTFEEQYRYAMTEQESVSFEEYFPPLGAWFKVNAYPSETGLSVYFQDVTERKRREQELEEYERIIETVNDGIYVVDSDGYYTFVNEQFATMMGRPREEFIGAHVSDFVSSEVIDTEQEIQQALEEDDTDVATVEVEVTRADGETVYAESTFANLPGGGDAGRVGVVRDITSRLERERQLERYQTIVETVQDGIYAIGDDERFVLVNEGFCKLTGHDREEILGSPATMFYDGEAKRYVDELSGDMDDEHSVATIELDVQTKDGGAIPCETRFTRFQLEDGYGRCGVTRDISDRIERERELQNRIRQQEVVTELGQRALEDRDLDELMAEAAEQVAETLGNDYCKVLDLNADAEELLLRQGVGWNEGIAGNATVSSVEHDSQAAYTLASRDAVMVEDLATETRFSGPELLTSHDVRSGISTIIGSYDDPWGILGTHDTSRKEFSEQDVNFVQSVANILSTAIQRHEYEQELLRQREQLEALNHLNGVVHEITDSVIDQSTREEIETTVCEQLAASDSYLFAWIGDVETNSNTVQVRTEAGAGAYLDDITISVDPDDDRSTGPTGQAFISGEMQVTQDVTVDSKHDPWRDEVEAAQFRSSAAIPIVHENTLYGVLNVYAERPHAFDGQERAVIEQLGEVVGHAIAAVERKRALMSDEVVALDFGIQNVFEAQGIPVDTTGTITLDQSIPLADGEFLVYGTATPDAVDTVRALVAELPYWEDVTFYTDGDPARFELRLSDPPVLSVVASLGGYVDSAIIEDGDYRMTIHLSPSTDVRRLLDAVQDAYPGVEMLRRQQISRTQDGPDQFRAFVTEELTERQRTTLEAAYHAGFFEWPRDTSGEDVASSLDISPPTFHQHLRKAEKKVFDSLLSPASDATSATATE